MKSADELIAYLNCQFPATVGHIPLKEMLNTALLEAAKVGAEWCVSELASNSPVPIKTLIRNLKLDDLTPPTTKL